MAQVMEAAVLLLLASGFVATAAIGALLVFAIRRRLWRWQVERAIRRRLEGLR